MTAKEKKKGFAIVSAVALLTIAMSIVDGVFAPPYLLKSIIKIALFLGAPFLYMKLFHQKPGIGKKLFTPDKKDLLLSLGLGAGVFAVIMTAYFCCRGFIDFAGIQKSLTSGIGVTADNFVFVAIYISLANSLLEEFFFRGFAFIVLKEETNRVFAYVFSAAMFALYHVGMTSGWFNIGIFLLMMFGLFAGGCIFNFLNEKCGNIYPSWLVHLCANLAINAIGFILFGIIRI